MKYDNNQLPKSFEHYRESIIGHFTNLKKEIITDHKFIINSIDNYIIEIDRANNHRDVFKVAIRSINELDNVLEKKSNSSDKKNNLFQK